MADSIPAEKFGVTVRTIYDWRHWPGIERYFWFSKKGRTNMWPMMVYHLACLHPAPRPEQRTDAEGTYAGGASVRVAPGEDLAAIGREKRNAALAKQRAQKTLPLVGGVAVVTGSATRLRMPKSETFRAISAQARNLLRRMAEGNFGSEPMKTSAESRNKLRPAAEENFGPEPKKTSAAGRNVAPPPAEADCRHIEPQNRVTVPSESFKRLSTRASGDGEGEPATPALATKLRQRESEREFLDAMVPVVGSKELQGNGALWRTFFRQNKPKAWACLHETASMLKEKRIKTTAAKAMMDLWKNDRLAYDRKEATR